MQKDHDLPTAAPRCHLCGCAAGRECAACAKPFCPNHGGERWCWLTERGPASGGDVGTSLMKRWVCDACTPSPRFLALTIVLSLLFLAVLFGLACYNLSSFPWP